MSPRGLTALARLVGSALVLLIPCWTAFSADQADRPNIIFILADDLGYGDLGCFGQQRIRTPRLDRMAAEGMRFTNFYAGSTVCAPSRCVLMTGRHVGHCYIRGNARYSLPPEEVTVAEMLKSAGYATGLFGKWGLGQEGSTGLPTRQGFDEYFGYLDQHHAHNYYPAFLIRGEQREPLRNVVPGEGDFGSGVASEKVEYSHDLVMREALSFVERRRAQPFFMYLALTIPHANNEAKNLGMEVPDQGEYAALDWPEPQKGHAAMISLMDRDIGRLLDKLGELGIDERTIVIFSSDNGPHREGGNDPDFNDSNGPLRGIKRDLTEGGIRVPTIVRWPGHVPAGGSSDHVGYFGDLMATAAELSGASAPSNLDSISFLPACLGRSDAQRKHDYLYWEFYERESKQAVRMGRWKAIRQPMFTGPIELYDLETDLGEEHNIAARHADVVERAAAAMAEAHVPSPLWKIPDATKRAHN